MMMRLTSMQWMVSKVGFGVLLIAASAAWAEDRVSSDGVSIVRPSATSNRISALDLSDARPKIEAGWDSENDSASLDIEFHGRFKGEEANLLHEKNPITLDPEGLFTLRVPAKSEKTEIQLIAVDAKGQLRSETLIAEIPNYTTRLAEASTPSRLSMSVGLQPSYITYSEERVTSFTQTALTAKASASYLLFPPNWDVAGSAFYTLLPLSHTQPTAARFLGLNFRVGYKTPWLSGPWELRLMGGWYYTTMFVSDLSYGFRNMNGPQLFPTARRTLGNGAIAGAYFKFSPVTDGLSPLSLSNREIAAGLSYSFPPGQGGSSIRKKRWSLLLDFASMQLSIRQRLFKTNSLSLGVGRDL
jgi:hypothetical protein